MREYVQMEDLLIKGMLNNTGKGRTCYNQRSESGAIEFYEGTASRTMITFKKMF